MSFFFPPNDSMLVSYNEQTRSTTYFTLLYEPFDFWKCFFHCVWVCFQFSLPPNLLPTCPFTNGHYILLKLTFLWLHTSFSGFWVLRHNKNNTTLQNVPVSSLWYNPTWKKLLNSKFEIILHCQASISAHWISFWRRKTFPGKLIL